MNHSYKNFSLVFSLSLPHEPHSHIPAPPRLFRYWRISVFFYWTLGHQIKKKKPFQKGFFFFASHLAYLMVAKSEPALNLTTFFAGILISFLV